MALLCFGALTALALIGWFKGNPVPWSWKSLLAVGCAVLGAHAREAGDLWAVIAPSRGHAVFGIAIMVASLARIGPPREWTWVSFALVAVTFVLLMPLVHAAIVLRTEGSER